MSYGTRIEPPEAAPARRWAIAALLLLLVVIAVAAVARLGLGEVLDWAWRRHHNPLSWYIRPLFLIPFAYFAYRRTWLGMTVTLLALATSIAWFPAPDRVDPSVTDFLAAEKEWILGEWTVAKLAMTALAPLSLVLLGAAFWRRAWWLGVVVMALTAATKVFWSFAVGDDSARAIVVPATLGLGLCLAAVMIGVRRARGRPEARDGAGAS